MADGDTHSRLLWMCRRGMRETEALLSRFVSRRYDRLTQEQRRWFGDFLQQSDQDILDWIGERQAPRRPEFAAIAAMIRAEGRHERRLRR